MTPKGSHLCTISSPVLQLKCDLLLADRIRQKWWDSHSLDEIPLYKSCLSRLDRESLPPWLWRSKLSCMVGTLKDPHGKWLQWLIEAKSSLWLIARRWKTSVLQLQGTEFCYITTQSSKRTLSSTKECSPVDTLVIALRDAKQRPS